VSFSFPFSEELRRFLFFSSFLFWEGERELGPGSAFLSCRSRGDRVPVERGSLFFSVFSDFPSFSSVFAGSSAFAGVCNFFPFFPLFLLVLPLLLVSVIYFFPFSLFFPLFLLILPLLLVSVIFFLSIFSSVFAGSSAFAEVCNLLFSVFSSVFAGSSTFADVCNFFLSGFSLSDRFLSERSFTDFSLSGPCDLFRSDCSLSGDFSFRFSACL